MDAVLVFPRASLEMVEAHVRSGQHVVAIDAGAEVLRAAGLTPARIVGDMDSVRADTLAHFEKLGVPLERHPAAKRDTDAALALAGLPPVDRILFLGAGGGRVDHAIANLHLLARAQAQAPAWAVDEHARTWIATPERPLELALPEGAIVSAFPFDGPVQGIHLDGFRYPLAEASMEPGDPYGTSNEALAPPQRVRVRSGHLLVIQPTADL